MSFDGSHRGVRIDGNGDGSELKEKQVTVGRVCGRFWLAGKVWWVGFGLFVRIDASGYRIFGLNVEENN